MGLQLAALVVLGGVTVARLHVWAPVDERPHYDYVQKLAEERRLPLLDDLVSPEVQAITDRTWPEPSPKDPATIGLAGRSYEAFQPPLYYLLAAPVFLVEPDHRRKVEVLRGFNLLLVLLTAALVWRLSVALAPAARLAGLSAGLAVLLWPGVLVRGLTVSGAALEYLLVTALLLASWSALEAPGRRRTIVVGALFGACLLTKSTLVYLAPLLALVAVADWRRNRELAGPAIALALPLVMLAPWLAHNLEHYDALTPSAAARAQQLSVVNPGGIEYGIGDAAERTVRLVDAVLPVEFAGQLDVLWVRIAVIAVFAALFLAAALLPVLAPGPRTWRLLAVFALPLVVGYAMLVVTLLSANWPSFNLRYLYPVLPALAVAVAGALWERHPRAVGIALGATTFLLAALWVDMAGAFYFTDVGDRLGI